ncbi:transposase [Clostridium estertheticum]|uniref:RNA-guided endonuclease InsQ/TnpB family protein n=1 Tax=Clostridium estertheticum TaxID=238834 RepID=UPI001CD09D37|nr:RNA-guided endonuclease TnpB family protein [Clostridium estertheticum]MBZ9685909.1 transposase [Clostridium estertheticum]MBZ9688859.1 transposase [Clostridium estertheticum]MBZ9689105.1 transposase [Clostridium estertheticum]
MTKKITKSVLFGVQKQQLKHLNSSNYEALRGLCFLSKNMYNVALYNIRQYYFTEKKFLGYNSNYHLCKYNENYTMLNSNSAQQMLKVADRNFKSFFALIKMAKKGEYQYRDIKLPGYLPKDGFFNLIFNEFNSSKDKFSVPMSTTFKRLYGKVEINIPSNLKGKAIKEVRILPKNDARFFEIQWVYEIDEFKGNLNKNNTLAIDLGIDNLCACTINDGKAFIIDGKKLKSINQWANKENSRLQSIKDKQKIKTTTKAQKKLWNKRSNRVNDYLNKTVRVIIDYCLNNDIGSIVVGYNPTIQRKVNLGKVNNQNFVNIPIGNIRERLTYQSQRYNINLIEQEESYTSKADFLANDSMPIYSALNKKRYLFSGKRISRGQYKSSKDLILNADINGSLNIMRKSNIKQINLNHKEYLNPIRTRIA